jgi:hypothetical protein
LSRSRVCGSSPPCTSSSSTSRPCPRGMSCR